jgi:hypothetical protein
MVRFSDLPQIAVEHILRSARGRSIAGSNKYARVCRQWRDVENEAEPLQLFMNLSHLSEADLARAASWLSVHGQHVDVLVAHINQYTRQQQFSWLVNATPTLRNVQRLEVAGHDSLRQLVPVLQQLPQLQHLEAGFHMSLQAQPDHGGFTGTAPQQDPGQQVPNMQELCPHLTSMTLEVTPTWSVSEIDHRLSHLFGPGLQQLRLSRSGCGDVYVCASGVGHLSALQQLTLDGVNLIEEGAHQLAQELGALQQLRLYHFEYEDVGGWAPLAPKLTEYEVWLGTNPWGPTLHNEEVLSRCGHLTRLVLNGRLSQGTTDALAALTGLRELGLYADPEDITMEVVQQLAGMPRLRSLQLQGLGVVHQTLAAGVAQWKQLTSLVLLMHSPFKAGGVVSWAWGVQQLTGLQSLTVTPQVVAEEQGAWLAPLTRLTSLCVQLSSLEGFAWDDSGRRCFPAEQRPEQRRQRFHAAAERVLAHVPQWPAGLRQVLFSVKSAMHMRSESIVPMCWQLPLAGPGRAQVAVWLEEQDSSAAGWSRPFRPCPHLPGVWELQGAVQGRPWDSVVDSS